MRVWTRLIHLVIDFAAWRATRLNRRADFWADVMSAIARRVRLSDVRRHRQIREWSNYESEAVDLDLLARN